MRRAISPAQRWCPADCSCWTAGRSGRSTTKTTKAPTALKPPEQYFGLTPDDPIWEYAAAPFAFSFAPGQIAVNNDIVVVQGNHSAYVQRNATACPNQRSWSGRVWNTVTQGNVTSSQTSKQLSFTLGTSGTADLQGTYYTDCTIAGAFTAKVHYTLNTWPSANGVRVGLLVNNPDYPFAQRVGHRRADKLRRFRRCQHR